MPARIDQFPTNAGFQLVRTFQMRQDEMKDTLFELLVNIFLKTNVTQTLTPDDAARLALGKNQVVKFMNDLDTLQKEFLEQMKKTNGGGDQ